MFSNREKIKIALFLLLAALGFATGINYRANLSDNSITTIKGCFEFGIYPLLEGRNNADIFIDVVVCTIKHYLLLLSGVFSWVVFPVVPINLFCICFKIGVSLSYVFSILGVKGIFCNFFLFLFCLLIMSVAVMLSYLILNRRIYHISSKKFDYYDLLFIKKSVLCLVMFSVVLILFLYLFKITDSGLYGLLNTFL